MRRGAAFALWLSAALLPLALGAQEVAPSVSDPSTKASSNSAPMPAASPILSLDQEVLFSRSKYGQALHEQLLQEARSAEAEARKIDAALEQEERDLTAQRDTLTAEAFTPLARAFDEKVQRLRAEREAAAAALSQKEEAARATFIAEATKIIGDYMVERGAVAIVDKQALIVSLLSIDVTNDIVARIDASLVKGDLPAP